MPGRFGRRSLLLTELTEHAHRPFQVAGTVLAVQFAVRFTTGYAVGESWRRLLLHLLILGVIAAVAWLVACAAGGRGGHRAGPVPGRRAGQPARPAGKTQVVMLRRLTIAVIVVLTLGVMLMTFPSVRGSAPAC